MPTEEKLTTRMLPKVIMNVADNIRLEAVHRYACGNIYIIMYKSNTNITTPTAAYPTSAAGIKLPYTLMGRGYSALRKIAINGGRKMTSTIMERKK